MKKIPLSQGKFALVDDQDYDVLNQWRWYALKDHRTFYACRKTPNPDGDSPKQKMIQMAHAVLTGKESNHIDHINGNGLDNRRSNLRLCTPSQNGANQRLQQNCS